MRMAMEEIKYHTLINDGDTDMIPMFFTTNLDSVKNRSFYLTEIVPHYYRFCSKKEIANDVAAEYKIHCPYCGSIMHPIASSINNNKHSLYTCDNCW